MEKVIMWKQKVGLAIISLFILLNMAACSSQEQEDVQSIEDNRSSSAGSVRSEAVIDEVAPVQYVYSSDTVTFTEYGGRRM